MIHFYWMVILFVYFGIIRNLYKELFLFFFRTRIPTWESKTMPEIIKRYQSIVFLLLPRRTFKSPAQCHSTTNQHHHHPYPLSSSYVVVVVYRGSNFDHFWQSCIQESDYFLQPWELRPQSSGGILMYSITVNLSIPTSILNMYCTYTQFIVTVVTQYIMMLQSRKYYSVIIQISSAPLILDLM